MTQPRPEYPRPQFVRDKWLNLNGEWDFYIDSAKSGRERRIWNLPSFEGKIIVPFCPESELSGVNNKDFMECVWYKTKISHPFRDDLDPTDRILLHIDACDYAAEVYVNGVSVGRHIGGYTPFYFDITDALKEGENDITVCADDNLRSGRQPAGKQCMNYYSGGCSYTRTTGIWQTVWLEAVPASRIEKTKYTTVVSENMLTIEATTVNAHNKTFIATVSFGGEYVISGAAPINGDNVRLQIELDGDVHLWSPKHPELYDLDLYIMENGKTTLDHVRSYFGMRTVAYDDAAHRFYINGESIFMRLILDQGFYPTGIYTAPSDSELIADIKRSMDMGFNGARLHQKIFEPRFIYHCDRMGYIVWDEHANWCCDLFAESAWQGYVPEWLSEMERDINSPAVIGWCPFNETQYNQNPWLIKAIYDITKAYDPTRPVIDCSGWKHVATDIVDAHDYDQDPKALYERHMKIGAPDNTDNGIVTTDNRTPRRLSFISEYGGIWWQPENPEKGWGYGNRPASPEEFVERYKGLTEALLSNPYLCGFCYTQLTDIEQEVNGLYYYNRTPKFDPDIIRPITSAKAACEE